MGNQVKRQKEGFISTYEFDNEGHKTGERDAKGGTQSWVYDKNGHVTEHTDLGGHKTKYTYNTNGLLVKEQSTAEKTRISVTLVTVN